MDARDFLQRVLPHGDGYFYGALVANGKFHQHRFNSIQALIRYADSCKEKRCDTYFATGSFSEKRTASDCRNKRALYLDIDTGHGKLYPTKKDAVRALFDFCDERFVRPNILVDSGGGIHAYWTFTHEISTDDWLPMAVALKDLCELHALAADPTVTADAARILRIPGTFNVKEAGPRQVRILHATTKEFKPKRLRKILGTNKSESLQKLGALAQEMDLDFAVTGEGVPFFAGKIIERCNVLAHTYETGGAGQVEPLWMAQLSLMAYAVDGSEYIHSLSDQHAEYDYQRTEKKYTQRLAVKESGKYGPPLCKTLGMYLPEKCKTCRFNGRIKSPIVLGREEDGTEIPFPYKQDDKAVYRLENKENENGEVESKAVKILSFAIEDFQLFSSSPDPSAGMVYRFSVDKYGNKQATFTTSALADKRKLLVELSNADVPLHPHEYAEFVRLMTTWADKMIQAKQVGQPTMSLGWTKVNEEPAFTLIDKTITKSSGDKEVTFTGALSHQ
jgi:hypothetical protein